MPKPRGNPFHLLLKIVGTLFAISACAYAVMAVKMLDPAQRLAAAREPSGLIQFLDQYGVWLLFAEIVLLALLAVLAMATDSRWKGADTATADSSPTSGADATATAVAPATPREESAS